MLMLDGFYGPLCISLNKDLTRKLQSIRRPVRSGNITVIWKLTHYSTMAQLGLTACWKIIHERCHQ